MNWSLAMDKRVRGRQHYSRPGGLRSIYAITNGVKRAQRALCGHIALPGCR
jgi:hypothetical protein